MKKYLVALLLSASISFCYAQEALQKVKINLFDGGQNSYDLSDVLNANQGESLKNVVLSKKGVLSKRGGQSIFGLDNGNSAFDGAEIFKQSATNIWAIAASGTSVIRTDVSSPLSWTVINPSNPITAGKAVEFIQANNTFFIFNGFDNTCWYDGTTFLQSTVYPTSPPTISCGAWLANYLFGSGNPTYPDYVYFSNNLSPTVFSASDLFRVNTGDGQKVVWLEPFKLTELIIYKENSIFNLDISGATPLTDWTLQPVSTRIGCVAPRSVVNVGNDQVFLSSDPIAVRSLVRTSYDKLTLEKLSGPIQDIFDDTGDNPINRNAIKKACATLYDDKYILAIPAGSSTVNNYVCVLDFVTKSWYIITGWYPADWITYQNNLYYVDAKDGRIVECFTGTVGDLATGPTTSSAASVAISYEYISKNINFDNSENYKSLDSIEVEFGTTGDYDGDVYINIDDGGFQYIGSVNLSGDVVTLPVTLPFTLFGEGRARKTFQLTEYGQFRNLKVKVVQDGLSESCKLYSATVFASVEPWRRE